MPADARRSHRLTRARLLALVAVVAFVAVVPASPQQTSGDRVAAPETPSLTSPDTTIPDVVREALPAPRPTFRVGVAELANSTADPEAGVAAVTFPRLLYEDLAAIAERDLSADELEELSQRRLEQAIVASAAQLRNAVDSRDRLLFDRASAGQQPERRAAADDAVARARERLDALTATDPAVVPAEAVRPLVYWAGHEEGRLLPVSDDPAALVEAEDLDMLIAGAVEEIEGYLAIDITVYHRWLETTTTLEATIARPEEIGLDAPLVAAELAELLLGRRFAILVVETPLADAAIEVNDALLGFGRVRARYLRPGPHDLTVRADGHLPVRLTLTLEPDEERVERVELEEAPVRTVRLQSSPSGADVYADSVWVGTTPLEREFPGRSTIVRIRAPGYLESRFIVDSTSPPVVTRALLPDAIDWTSEIASQRDEFYRSLTWFVVSLPVTILLNGGYEGVRGAFPAGENEDLSQSELERLAQIGNILYWSSIGSLVVNVGLFVNLAFTILDYVEVGEGPHNQ